jgi:hypothetical protein
MTKDEVQIGALIEVKSQYNSWFSAKDNVKVGLYKIFDIKSATYWFSEDYSCLTKFTVEIRKVSSKNHKVIGRGHCMGIEWILENCERL